MNLVKTERSLSVFTLAMINVAAVTSINFWPLMAEYGLSSLFFFLLIGLCFFFPVSFVSAELTTGWPERGGVFTWVKEAFGHRMGFLAIWLQWIENVVWYPTILSFMAAALAYCIKPALGSNKIYMVSVILAAFWGSTWINLRGMKASGFVSSFGVLAGTILPGAVIIALGLSWTFSGKPVQIEFSIYNLIPNLNSPTQLSLLAGALFNFVGMEMSSVHARDALNPRRTYPRAILLSAFIIIILSALGTLVVAIILPQKEISIISGGVEAISHLLKTYKLTWLIPFLSFFIGIGALSSMSTWIAGPCKGLLAAAQSGEFPPILHKVNKNDMPTAMMVMQGVIVSALSLLFLFLPDISSTFWILLILASQLYMIMYILMFASAIKLRYKRPDVMRAYTIPCGNFGMWCVAGIGLLSSCAAFFIGFFPPAQLAPGNLAFYELFLVIGNTVLCSVPTLILLFKKPSWNIP